MAKFKHFAVFSLGVLACISVPTPASAGSITLTPPTGYSSGMPITLGGVEIGDLFFKVSGNLGIESAEFDLLPQYRSLMNDVLGQQFRFFQVITFDTQPVTWNGSTITPPGTANHVGTVVDTPAGGWDYMASCGGDDNSPFYESDTAINSSTRVYYCYNWAYTGTGLPGGPVHAPDGSTQGWVKSQDQPLLSLPNGTTLLETYITYVNPPRMAHNAFDVLGGFAWGVYSGPVYPRSDSFSQFGIAPTAIPFKNVAELQGALDRSGYGDWTIVPESSTAITILIGLVLIGLKRFRFPQLAKAAGSPAPASPARSRSVRGTDSSHFKNG